MSFTRRNLLAATGTAFGALLASGCMTRGTALASGQGRPAGYGALTSDPAGLLDLPKGFSYRVLSRLGDAMDDGLTVPDKADGMGCIDLGNGEIALVRNHELVPSDGGGGPIPTGFDKSAGGTVLPGGTTTLVLDARTLAVKRQHRSLAGTVRNCAGGVTPWGSWLTCEEFVSADKHVGDGKLGRHHGWVFEVPANARGLVEALPIKAMGRFNHEAACVDPRTNIVYLTEDRDDSLLYRFLPDARAAHSGRLQAMVLEGVPDARNWNGSALARADWLAVRWIDLADVEAPEDDLRKRGAAAGATMFARGEGIHMGAGELYFCCTSGGAAKLGQIFRLQPATGAGPDRAQLFFESENVAQFNYGDNLTVAPNGHLIVCEDQYTPVVDNHIKGITPDGRSYDLARLRLQTELAGACFSPDGRTLFVNAYEPATTLAVTGPWAV